MNSPRSLSPNLEDFLKAASGFRSIEHFIATSEQGAANVTGTFDMIFVDSGYTYEDVKSDILRWWPRLRAGGIIAFHGYSDDAFPGVKSAVDELLGTPSCHVGSVAWLTKPK